VKLLLDSHAVIWWVDHDELLSKSAHEAIADPQNELLISAASLWEISIKVGIGKLKLSFPYREWMSKAVADLRASILPISVESCDAQCSLPFHHSDPFDRLIIAQSSFQQITIVSSDDVFDRYGVHRLW
jgi:PIN domain nuclease of toxin-antitoxin system